MTRDELPDRLGQSASEKLPRASDGTSSRSGRHAGPNPETPRKAPRRSGRDPEADAELRNLLGSTEVATIFLDTDCNVRRYTPNAAELLDLTPGHVGRPIASLTLRIRDSNVVADARHVLRFLEASRRKVYDQGGRTYMRGIEPRRTSEGRVDGVVVTYTDVSAIVAVHGRLRRRLRQQATVVALGRRAATGATVQELLDQAVEQVREALGDDFVKILEYRPADNIFLLRAGLGWDEGLVGSATVEAGMDSHAGYTIVNRGPVIIEDLATETRFRSSSLLTDHGVVSGVSVLIGSVDRPWGVLGTHSRGSYEFSREDVNFLQAVAHVLAVAIEAIEIQARLRVSEERLGLFEQGSGVGSGNRGVASDADITDRRGEGAGAARSPESLRRVALDGAHVGAWDWEIESGRIRWGSGTGSRPHGPSPVPDVDTVDAALLLIHGEDREAAWMQALEAIEGGGDYEAKFRVLWPDGSLHWLMAKGVPLERDSSGRTTRMVGVHVDITEMQAVEEAPKQHRDELDALVSSRTADLQAANRQLRASESRLRLLTRRLFDAQEETCGALSQELHEVFSQRLAVLAFQVGDLVDLANEPDDKFREQAGRVRSAIEQLSGHIYEMARRLHPKILDDLGLAAALGELCDAFGDNHRIDVSFSSPEEMPLLDPKRALCLYGVAQEAMTNVARHAWASRLKVALTIVDGRSVLRISDDGIGFDVEERLTTGPGLAGMKERVESLGGQLDITSDPGRGTTVEARVSTEGYPP